MTAVPEPAGTSESDAVLLERARGGDRQAFAVLWNRHRGAGLKAARAITSSFDAEDLVSEAFVRVMKAIERGNGPTAAFRPYLLTTVRSVAARWGGQPVELTPEELEVVDPATSEEAFSARFDQGLTVRAFNTLPRRWQEVLWYTEAEQLPPREVAGLLGIKPNAVSALARRAREGLRHAWVQAHIESVPADSECRWAIDRLAASTRKPLPSREQARLDAHLDQCDRCPLAAEEMAAASRRLGALILIGFLGAGAATAYGALLKPAAATAATLGAGVGTGAGAGAGASTLAPKSVLVWSLSLGGGAVAATVAVVAGVAIATSGASDPGAPKAPAAIAQATEEPTGRPAPQAAPAAPAVPAPSAPPPSADPGPAPAAAPPPAHASRPATEPVPGPAAPVPAAPAPDDPPTTPAPTAGASPTPTPGPGTAPLTFAIDTNGSEFYPVVTGTASPGASVTIAAAGQSVSVVADADGDYASEGQLSWLPDGASTLTITQHPSSGPDSSVTTTVKVAAPIVVIGVSAPGVTALIVTANPGSMVEVVSDVGSVFATVDPSGVQLVSMDGEPTTLTVRYADGNGRYGPSSPEVL